MNATEDRKTYNGWANYETWATALCIDNEQATYGERRERAEHAWTLANDAEHTPFTPSEYARIRLAEDLKDWIGEEMRPDLGASLYSDLLGAALSEVDWMEIADNFLSDVDGYEAMA